MWSSLLVKVLQALIFPIIDKLWDKIDEYLKRKKSAETDRKTGEQ